MERGRATPGADPRWVGRPWLARAVRVVVATAPVAFAVACSSLMSRALPVPTTPAEVVRWWAIVLVVSTSALVVAVRFSRRLLPLSVLLKLSLPFPDAPPSRLRVAIRSGSSKQLEQWAQSVAARGDEDPKAVAAQDLLGLVAALSAHDRRSRGHSERVRVYTDLMAEQLRLSRDDADKLRWAGLLHDIGKLRVPREILNKPGAPDESEWDTIRRHPIEGDRLITPVRNWLGRWSLAVLDHHERWDGTGYPNGLAGFHISLAGRVVAVTDSYEVMTATRSYKKPMSPRAARAELTRAAGTHFDPDIVRAFLSVPIGRASWALGPVAWFAQLPFLAQVPTWGATAIVATGVVAATPVMSDLPLRLEPVSAVHGADNMTPSRRIRADRAIITTSFASPGRTTSAAGALPIASADVPDADPRDVVPPPSAVTPPGPPTPPNASPPSDPATPSVPADPAVPATPATPSHPATPAVPATPSDSGTPAVPATPATPATPAEHPTPAIPVTPPGLASPPALVTPPGLVRRPSG